MNCAVCETATVGRDLDGPSMAQWRPILIVSLVVVNSDQIKQLKRFQGEKPISFNKYQCMSPDTTSLGIEGRSELAKINPKMRLQLD